MKRQIEKIMTMAVAAGLMTSMLCGEVSHAAKVKTPYYKTGVKTDYLVKDTAFYKKTGEVSSLGKNMQRLQDIIRCHIQFMVQGLESKDHLQDM